MTRELAFGDGPTGAAAGGGAAGAGAGAGAGTGAGAGAYTGAGAGAYTGAGAGAYTGAGGGVYTGAGGGDTEGKAGGAGTGAWATGAGAVYAWGWVGEIPRERRIELALARAAGLEKTPMPPPCAMCRSRALVIDAIWASAAVNRSTADDWADAGATGATTTGGGAAVAVEGLGKKAESAPGLAVVELVAVVVEGLDKKAESAPGFAVVELVVEDVLGRKLDVDVELVVEDVLGVAGLVDVELVVEDEGLFASFRFMICALVKPSAALTSCRSLFPASSRSLSGDLACAFSVLVSLAQMPLI